MQKIQTRKEMTSYFQSCLVKSSKDNLQDIEEEEIPSKSLKSYIIESNTILDKISLKNFEVSIDDTKDSTLKSIKVSNKDNEEVKFYADLLDRRFFILHSVGESKITDSFIHALITQRSSYFDFPWFFNEFMDKTSLLGANESFTVKFRNEFLQGNEDISDIGKFSMRFWGNNGKKRLDEINKNTSLKTGTALSNVGIKIGDSSSFIKENISFSGRFAAIQGNSINEHFSVLNKLKSLYSQVINKVESNALKYSIFGEKVSITGEPMIISFDKEIKDIKFFVKILTSSKVPFRIWGIPEFIEDDYISVSGIDLHTGDKIDFELTKKWMRIYLPEGSCGNIITRLLTNIQHFFDSNAKLLISGEQIK